MSETLQEVFIPKGTRIYQQPMSALEAASQEWLHAIRRSLRPDALHPEDALRFPVHDIIDDMPQELQDIIFIARAMKNCEWVEFVPRPH